MYKKYDNYDKFPAIEVKGCENEAFCGYESITGEILKRANTSPKTVIVLDFYPNVHEKEVLEGFSGLNAVAIFNAEDCMVSREQYSEMIAEDLTDDRVFGVMTTDFAEKYFITDKLLQMKKEIDSIESGIVLVYGVFASLVTTGDILVYCDLARWEIQTRYKQGEPNFHSDNDAAPQLSKYKQGFFLEWRLADRHKKQFFDEFDYILDTNLENEPKMITKRAVDKALERAAGSPFRLVPYFDPGVWGGQWMKEVCNLPRDKENYAWSFDGVPEENSLYFRFGDIRVELPAIDLVFFKPRELLGERVHARFGAEFPIRFDFLDTMGGQNLSLQVHPLTEYIQERFGMHYTQDESYYILDCEDDAYVYAGLKDGIDPKEMIEDLRKAEKGESFDADKYTNKIKVKKHDHLLIPAGTVHCSGEGTMVLEISATPYIFTFKLWDWGRLGLDGLPRPIHVEHGARVIAWERTTDWVMKNLIHRDRTIEEYDGVKVEWTGLHEREFIETVRHTFSKPAYHKSNDSVSMLNLVEGEEAEVFSPDDSFEPFVVHYAETFVIPASVGEYGIRPTKKSKGQTLKTIKAFVR